MDKMFVSVIIPTRNRRASVIRTVHSVLRQSYPESGYEILVCCDRCTDGTEQALVDTFGPQVKVLQSTNAGACRARNTGLRAARGDIALFMDDDVGPEPGFLRAHVDAHGRESQRKLLVTGTFEVEYKKEPSAFERDQGEQLKQFLQQLPPCGARGKSPLLMFGASFSIRTGFMREAGGFNESYRFQRDDLELALRLARSGFVLEYCPAAIAKLWIELGPEQLLARTQPRAQNDYRLALEYPESLPYLPFYSSLREPGTRRKWKLAWKSHGLLVGIVSALRRLAPDNVRLVHLEYAARYCEFLRQTVGDWNILMQLCTRDVATMPITPVTETDAEGDVTGRGVTPIQ